MIITKLIGGLGNQLFQYAIARNLAMKHNTELKIDISAFKEYTLRGYSLSPFNIIENIASDEEITSLKTRNPVFFERLVSKVFKRPLNPPPTYVYEKHFHYDPEIMTLPDNSYLEGYWQSEKYFSDIAETIRNEFTIKIQPTGLNKELTERIKSCVSVSIHIRRGDYVKNPYTSRIHGICDIEYFLRGMNYLGNQICSPHYFIFSDDPDWVINNFNIPYQSTYVTHNHAQNDFEDLRLMSQCQHHIIANSTFSWWGAWLCRNLHKIVIAPQRWFNDADKDMKDLIPASWKRM